MSAGSIGSAAAMQVIISFLKFVSPLCLVVITWFLFTRPLRVSLVVVEVEAEDRPN